MAKLPDGAYIIIEAYGDDYVGQLYDANDKVRFPIKPEQTDYAFNEPDPAEIISAADFAAGCPEFLSRAGWVG